MIGFISTQTNDLNDREYMIWLYKEFERLMYATAYKYTSVPQIAEDVVQDSILNLIQKIDTIRPMKRCVLGGYIVATIRNASINQIRVQNYEQLHLLGNPDELNNVPSDFSLEDLIVVSEHLDGLSKIWLKLAPETQFLLEGKYILGYNDKELARKLSCKPSSIRMKLTRARRNALALLIELKGEKCYDEA